MVYEAAPRLTDAGAGITLWANAGRVLEALGILPEVLRCGSGLTELQLRNPKGEVLSRTNLADFGGSPLCVPRGDLIRCLAASVQPERLKTDHALSGIQEEGGGYRLTFENGQDAWHPAVVGADGIHSRVRAWLHGERPARYAGYVCWRGLARVPVEKGIFFESWGEGRRFGLAPCGDGMVYWYATLNAAAGHRPDRHRPALLETFADWEPRVAAAIEATPEDGILLHDIRDRPVLRRWGRGACTLLGDAAHPSTPNLGQGGGMALEDALYFARCLSSQSDITTAFRLYEAGRGARTRRVVELSARMGRVSQLGTPGLWKLRNHAIRLLPSSGFRNQIAPLHRHDPTVIP
ncbi:FAD-dependent monooxygenase [Luteolibacter sp. LG18]|nr:FAD-dependent monooxygenase [Luteolibacter sp. LG18]